MRPTFRLNSARRAASLTVGAVTSEGVQLRRVSASRLEILARTSWITTVRPLVEAR